MSDKQAAAREMASGVIALVERRVAAALAPFLAERAALQAQVATLEQAIAMIPAGRDGRDGQKGDPGDRGRDGIDGKNGKDGFGFDDFEEEFDGERTITRRYRSGDRVKEFTFVLPILIDRGFWKEGASVQKGDGVTFGGSYWIAQNDTTAKPEIGNPDWRLAVKKGRDGKDFSK